jgi:hypothetical protein
MSNTGLVGVVQAEVLGIFEASWAIEHKNSALGDVKMESVIFLFLSFISPFIPPLFFISLSSSS